MSGDPFLWSVSRYDGPHPFTFGFECLESSSGVLKTAACADKPSMGFLWTADSLVTCEASNTCWEAQGLDVYTNASCDPGVNRTVVEVPSAAMPPGHLSMAGLCIAAGSAVGDAARLQDCSETVLAQVWVPMCLPYPPPSPPERPRVG